MLSGRESGSGAGVFRLSMRWPRDFPDSRLPGGSFEIRGSMSPAGRIRVEVTDQGGPWHPVTDPSGQHGRGLLIVASLAADWGIHGGPDSRTAWLELGGS
jgi:hypothetical protein